MQIFAHLKIKKDIIVIPIIVIGHLLDFLYEIISFKDEQYN
jgi:hypothetical protein